MSTPARTVVAATVLVTLALSAAAPGLAASGPRTVEGAPATASSSSSRHAATAASDRAARRLVVSWVDGVAPSRRAALLDSVGARVVHDLETIVVVELSHPRAAIRAARVLRGDPAVAEVGSDRVVRAASADPGYEQQWGIENEGQIVQDRPGRVGMDARVVKAWDRTRGVPEVVVAVVDSGTDIAHPDLAANVWRNPLEEDNGVDDDDNGLVDDLHGWDFKHDDDSVFDDLDGDSHGTEIAGVVAAVADNDVGITGVAPGVRVMPLKFLEGGAGTMSDGLAALRYAARNGASVIVASWVGEQDHPHLRAVLEGTGVLIVAPAGNDGRDLSHGATSYPASYTLPNLLSVAAMDNEGFVASFSNTGSHQVDLAAPGRNVLTTDPSVDPVTGDSQAGYAYVSGTSMAAAFTAGAAALALSIHPEMQAVELADLIRRSSRPFSRVRELTITGGLLDAQRLVALVEDEMGPGACTDPPQNRFEDVSRTSVHVDAIDCLVYRDGAVGRDPDHFDPRAPVTRAAMATFLHRVVEKAGTTVEDPPDAYTDDDDSIHEPSIDALAELGIVEGREDGTYEPGLVVTRAQMATMLHRTYKLLLGGVPYPSRRWFDDTAEPHGNAIDVIRDVGIASGTRPRQFSPADGVRRDQMATFLVALLDVLARNGVIEPT